MKAFELLSLKIFNLWDPIEDKNFWEAIIEVPDTSSLFDFHLYIQRIIEFDNDHLFEFYGGRTDRNRQKIFSENSGYPHNGGDYKTIFLKDIYPLKRLKLYYLFDFGDNWTFEIHKIRRKIKIQDDCKYPRIYSENGIKLKQYNYEDVNC